MVSKPSKLKLHHTGYACRDIQDAIAYFKGHLDIVSISKVVYDAAQNVRLCMLQLKEGAAIELVEGCVVEPLLSSGDVVLYHKCYEVQSIEVTLKQFLNEGASQISEIHPATLFDNRKVVFLQSKLGLIELLEAPEMPVTVLANFNVNLVIEDLQKHLSCSSLSHQVLHFDISDIFYSLSDPASMFRKNLNGKNIIFISLKRWMPDFNNKLTVFCENLRRISAAYKHPVLVVQCEEPGDESNVELGLLKNRFVKILHSVSGVEVISFDLLNKYFIGKAFDEIQFRIAEIPYTDIFSDYFSTYVAAKLSFSGLKKYKVIVLDCDNTLWPGTFSENQVDFVRLPPVYLALQKLIKFAYESGYLLCAASKNNLGDLRRFFEKSDMPVRFDNFVLVEAGWGSKSDSIRKFSEKLNLSLDSFLFIDDNEVECNQVKYCCPAVCCLQFPCDTTAQSKFIAMLSQILASSTSSDINRTQLYRDNFKRVELQDRLESPEEFLESLSLEFEVISVNSVDADDLLRFAELSCRVNQFTVSGKRFDYSEIKESLCNQDVAVYLVRMQDRFGSYGVVGGACINMTESDPILEAFFVSCRALYRGAEYVFMASIASELHSQGFNQIGIIFKKTGRNQPAINFLKTVLPEFPSSQTNNAILYGELQLLACIEYTPDVTTDGLEGINAASDPDDQSMYVEAIFRSLIESRSRLIDDITPTKSNVLVPREDEVKVFLSKLVMNILELEEEPDDTKSFFELSGTSLLAVRLIAEIYKHYKVQIPLYKFLKTPTTKYLLGYILSRGLSNSEDQDALDKRLFYGETKVSRNESWLYSVVELSSRKSVYNLPYSYRFTGEVDVEILSEAISRLMYNYPALRSGFVKVDSEVRKNVLIDCHAPVEAIHGLKSSDMEQMIKSYYVYEFNLAHPPLFFVKILHSIDGENIIVFVFHHIIFDGISFSYFKKTLLDYYQKLSMGERIVPPGSNDYVVRENAINSDALEWWVQYIKPDAFSLNLPYDHNRPDVDKLDGHYISKRIEAEIYNSLLSKAKALGVSLYSVLLTGMTILLRIYSASSDVGFCITTSGRENLVDAETIGFHSYSLPFQVSSEDTPDLNHYIRNCSETLLDVLQNGSVRLDQISEAINFKRSSSHHPLSTLLFTFLGDNDPAMPSLAGCDMTVYKQGYDVARMDLVFELFECNSGLEIGLFYNVSLFYRDTAARLLDEYCDILSRMALCKRVDSFEYAKLDWHSGLDVASQGSIIPLRHRTIYEAFRSTVEKCSDKPAIDDGYTVLTYRDLDKLVSHLAAIIKNTHSVKPGDYVVIQLERTANLIAAQLAINLLGATFVCLDKSRPAKYNNDLVDRLSPTLIIFDNVGDMRLDYCCLNICGIQQRDVDSSEVEVCEGDLAYVFFTSGSTGLPKGVQITNRNAVNFIEWASSCFSDALSGGVLFSTSISFDISIFEIFGTLCSGGMVKVVKDVISLIDGHVDGVRLINTTNTNLEILIKHNAIPESVKYITFGGETPSRSCVDALYALPHIEEVYNLYGPTETTTYSSFKLLPQLATEPITVGKPIYNTRFSILNEVGEVVLPGEVGELYIFGEGVSAGYLEDGDKNNLAFFIDQNNKTNSKGYKTGDLFKQNWHGDFVWLGRKDNQMKVRGHRVNFAEVESILSRMAIVSSAAVALCDNSDGIVSLHAFLVLSEVVADVARVTREIKTQLKSFLPGYMIPDHFNVINSLPRLMSGKVDRKALSSLVDTVRIERSSAIRESDSIRVKLFEIWQGVLGYEGFGDDQNFFEIGGNSLSILSVLRACQADFPDLKIELHELYSNPTISELQKYIVSSSCAPEIDDFAKLSGEKSVVETDSKIAIVGYACQLPGADSLEALSHNLENSLCSITNTSVSFGSDYVAAEGVLSNIYDFDPEFFDYSRAEASIIDPQHRMFLELSVHALERAGYASDKYDGEIGVFAGCGRNQYFKELLLSNYFSDSQIEEMQMDLASEKDYLSTRVSYKLGLTGPSLNINTACSTSLVAISSACESLLLGSCEMALAGGIDLRLPEKFGYHYTENHVYSKDGFCRPFDSSASGTVPASGAGILVLKKLNDAVRDKDRVYGVIVGMGVNNDANKKVSFAAPSPKRQSDCIVKSFAAAKLLPKDLSYIEAHGTGTLMGDPIEVSAIKSAFESLGVYPQSCALGSIKANIGHTFVAAGVAGVLKVLAMMESKKIPPQISFDQLNESINLPEGVYVNKSLSDWAAINGRRLASVSSFGLGGTNAHLLLQDYAVQLNSHCSTSENNVFLISAKSDVALRQLKKNYVNFLTHHSEKNSQEFLYSLAATLVHGRCYYKKRFACICSSADSLISLLKVSLVDAEGDHTVFINSNTKIPETLLRPAQKWLEGGEVDWTSVYPVGSYYKVSLPLYPFQNLECKIDFSSNKLKALEGQGQALSCDTPIEWLSNKWCDLLGVPEVSGESDFFELGGRSILMIRLLSEVKQQYGVVLPYEVATVASKFSDFSKLLGNKYVNSQCGATLRCFKECEGPTIVFIHPGNGSLYHYLGLIEACGFEGAVYGVANPVESEINTSYSTIEQLADQYIALLGSLVRAKKLVFIGWSFGGSVAYEMARRLGKNQVDAVLMLDSWAKYPDTFYKREYFEKVVAGMPETDGLDISYIEQTAQCLEIRANKLFRYSPQQSDIKCILFKASDDSSAKFSSSNYWSEVCANLKTILVDGDHDTMMERGNLNRLVSYIKDTVQEVISDTSS